MSPELVTILIPLISKLYFDTISPELADKFALLNIISESKLISPEDVSISKSEL